MNDKTTYQRACFSWLLDYETQHCQDQRQVGGDDGGIKRSIGAIPWPFLTACVMFNPEFPGKEKTPLRLPLPGRSEGNNSNEQKTIENQIDHSCVECLDGRFGAFSPRWTGTAQHSPDRGG
jgi:hypothetical protein